MCNDGQEEFLQALLIRKRILFFLLCISDILFDIML